MVKEIKHLFVTHAMFNLRKKKKKERALQCYILILIICTLKLSSCYDPVL